MKLRCRHILLMLLIIFCSACTPQENKDRMRSLDDDFSLDDDNDTSPPPPWHEPDGPIRAIRSLGGTWTFIPEGYPARNVQVPCFWEAIPSWPGWEQYACPGYLTGTPDENLEIYEGSGWADRAVHRGVYLVDIDIAELSQVTKIWFESIHHQATVFLNDIEVGSHIAPYWKVGFDVSAAIKPGMNKLRVELVDGQALLGEDGITRWPVGYYSLTDITGIYRSVALESLPAVYVEDSFIVPSYRRRDLTIEQKIVNTTEDNTVVWLISRAMAQNGEIGLETVAKKVDIPAHGQMSVVVIEPWPDPVLWSPADPHLYKLRTLLMNESGEPIDLREDRFGFREVWIEGGNYMLNGMRMNLIGDSIDDQAGRPRYWAQQYFSCATARDTLQRIKNLNINAIRWHQAPPEECLFDLTDELGILVISESAVFARTDILPPFNHNQEYLENSTRWIDSWVRRLRNHPSVVMWSLENEMFMYGFALGMGQITSLQWPAKDADRIARPGGINTAPRPVNWDGDSSWLWWFYPEKPETMNWHYPNAGYFTIYPEREWYDDALTHFEPFLIDEAPCGVGETMVDRRSNWGDHTPDQAKAMQGIAVRAMRMIGFSDMRPYHLSWSWHFFYPDGSEHPWAPYYHSLYSQEEKDRLVKILRDSYHPIAVFDYEYTRTPTNSDGSIGPVLLPADATIKRTLVILNDSFLSDRPQTVSWSFVDETTEETLAKGEFEILIEHGANERRIISFDTPADITPHDFTLYLKCHMEGLPQGDFTTEYSFVTAGLNRLIQKSLLMPKTRDVYRKLKKIHQSTFQKST